MNDPEKELRQRIETLAKTAGSFPVQLYLLVFEAINKALLNHRKTRLEPITASELAKAMADIMQEQFGPFASHLLRQWGVHSTSEFGKAVYELVDANLLALNEGDSITDFDGLFPLLESLDEPFTAAPPYPDIQPICKR